MNGLERMAKAAFETSLAATRVMFPHTGDVPDKTWDTLEPRYRARWVNAQRAALTAIREADHDMTAAVVEPGDDRTEAMRVWSSIVEAILKGEA